MMISKEAAAFVAAIAVYIPFAGAAVGPDAFGYTAAAGTLALTDISQTGVNTNLFGDDLYTAPLPIGFSFRFYGQNYSNAYLSTNGLLTFNGGALSFSNYDFSTSPFGVPTIAAFWDDLYSDSTYSSIRYKTIGSPGSQKFIAQWDRVFGLGESRSPSTWAVFELVLSEGSNNVDLVYYDSTFTAGYGRDNGASATIGITNGTAANSLVWSNNTASVFSGTSVHFAAPTPEPTTLATSALSAAFLMGRRRTRAK